MSAQEDLPYGGTTGERLKSFALSDEARDRIAQVAIKYWELAAYGFLLIAAIVLRFYNLGARAQHHDESLHSYFGYGFTKGLEDFFTFGTANNDGYKHVPFMHGPFQFIGNGFVMWIFGDGDYQSRILAATLGTAMVAMPFLLRKQLGTFGALAVAFFICFSPTLTYYSRFTREDIYTAFWTFGIVIFAWRYMATQKDHFLYLLAGFMAGLFLTKETSFLTVGAFIFFFEFMWGSHLASKYKAKNPDLKPWQFVLVTLAAIAFGWILAFGWIFFEDFRKRYDLDELPPEANVLIVMVSLALPMYAAAVQLLPGVFGDEWRNRNEEANNAHINDAEFGVAMVSIFGLIGLGTALGLLWKPKVWAMAAAAFWVPFILLSTTFFSNMDGVKPDGFFSVIWGSLDYWISQQDVRRGNQPDHYYFITIPVYEFLPLVLSIAAGLYYFIRGNARNAVISACLVAAIIALLLLPRGFDVEKVSFFHVVLPFTLVLIAVLSFRIDPFTRFLLFWLVITSFALTVAGEKMPWLNVHIALPLAVLAGKFVGDMVENSDLRQDLPRLERLAPYFYASFAAGLSVLIFTLVGPFTLASLGAWLLAAVAAVAVYWAYTSYSPRTARQVAIVAAVAAFAVFTIRATVLSSWGHPNNPYKGDLASRDYGEVPVELLVYTQTSGDLPVLIKEVERAAAELDDPSQIPIVVDSADGFTWPWAWYLRDSKFKNVQYTTISDGYTPPQGAIIFASMPGANVIQQNPALGYGEGIPYHHRRWFPEEYRGKDGAYSTQDFFKDLFTPSVLFDNWLNYWIRREPPADIGAVDGVAFFPGDVDITPPAPEEIVREDGTSLVIGRTGGRQGELNSPSGVYIDEDGNLWVADTNNNRISKYDSSGLYQSGLGGFGTDVTMVQPWSLAVAGDGTVFVADTWNHKIVKFDSAGAKVAEWGAGGQTDTDGDGVAEDDDPFKLFGPRDITIAENGNVLITDTGNNRIIEYTSDGEFVRQFGSKGSSGLNQFSEPVAIEIGPGGDVYVGDLFNKRIVVLNSSLEPQRAIAVDTWGSRSVADKPYMDALDDGRILVADPFPLNTVPAAEAPQPTSSDFPGRILTYGSDGSLRGSYEVPAEDSAVTARPVGVAADGEFVLISDSVGNVIRRVPLSEVAK